MGTEGVIKERINLRPFSKSVVINISARERPENVSGLKVQSMKHILPNLIFFKKKGAEDAIGCTKDFLAQVDLTEVDRPTSKKLIQKRFV